MQKCHVLIIGAGMGGLTAALALQRYGFTVSVYEQAAAIREIGAGVLIGPNGKRVLDYLGIGKTIEDSAGIATGTYVNHYATGDTLRLLSFDATIAKYGMSALFVHRADLHTALYQAVLANDPDCVHVGHTFADLERDVTGVTARFSSGAIACGDVLIGADGNASSVRSWVFTTEPPKFTGQVALRALVPADRWSAELKEKPSAAYIGPGRIFLHYPLRRNTVMNVIGVGRAAQWEEEGWTIPAEISEFLELYSDYHPRVLDLIRAIPAGHLFKWGLRDREPLQEWTCGRVAMLGDAAHPIMPFLGQGANMALEDGLVLARCFEKFASIEEALARYETARKERGTNVQLWARDEADAMQGNTPKGFHPGRTAEDRGLFDYDAASVAI